MSTTRQQAQVIIIGAGLSGLSAAKWLIDNGVKNVLVLEARDRVGGRTLTKRGEDGSWVDLGGSYVGPTQDHILRLVKEFDLKTYLVNEKEKLVYFKDGKQHRFAFDEVPYLGIRPTLELVKAYQLLDELGKNIPVDSPWLAPNADELDKITYREFLEANFQTKEIRQLQHLIHNAFLAVGSHETSLLSVLWYIRQAFGAKRIFSTTNGGQERKIVGGSQQISEKMTEHIGSEKVLLNKAVHSIDYTNTNKMLVRTLDGNEYEAEHVIFAASPTLMSKIHFEPSLPSLKQQLIQRYPAGCVIKTIVYYETTWWRDMDMCGCVLIDDPDCPVEWTFDDTKHDGSYPAIMGFILADKQRAAVKLSADERRVLICESYARAFGSKMALDSINYEEFDWTAEQYSGGCYTGVCPPGQLTRLGPVLREPVGNMFFAGTEAATIWSGYMNGAVQAGERAAREVLHALGKIDESQIWAKEPESKDVPAKPFEAEFVEKYFPTLRVYDKVTKVINVSLVCGAGVVLYKLFKKYKLGLA